MWVEPTQVGGEARSKTCAWVLGKSEGWFSVGFRSSDEVMVWVWA